MDTPKSKTAEKAKSRVSPSVGPGVERTEIDMAELESILGRASKRPLEEGDLEKLRASLETLGYITQELEKKRVSVQRLKELLFGAPTEKTEKVIERVKKALAGEKGENSNGDGACSEKKKKKKGHGRNGAKSYTGARKENVPLEGLSAGCACPCCAKGKLYASIDPKRIVRVRGSAPLSATVYELGRLRCGLCGELFTADPPEGVGEEKYDAGSASMIGLLKYGMGFPFNRLAKMEGNLGIPLPAATQWDIVHKSAAPMWPAWEELTRIAAQGKVLHNDDTTMKILGLPESDEGRKGVYTSGIMSQVEDYRIALFFTGRRHAGENLLELLKHRAKMLAPPIQMCDALSRNMPEALETIVSNCVAHARRKFVDVAVNFPDECIHVLETLKEVYKNDAVAKGLKMSPEDRLVFHQAESGPRMAELNEWMTEQIENKKVEPNSGLGEAISYMRKHWTKLTQFLRVPGAPIDNNLCERALKRAILHRKNAYFYKTLNGARVGDLYMSFIHTCELNGANPFEYLTALQENAAAVNAAPGDWMPWNYRSAIKSSAAPRDG